MPTAQEIAMHPWLAGTASVLQTILAAKLMSNVSKENKKNREYALGLLNKEELENRSEKERLAALVEKMQGYYDTNQHLKEEQAKATTAKLYQDIAESQMKPTLEREKNASKEKREEARAQEVARKGAVESLLAEAKGYEKSMLPEEHAKLIKGIRNGTITEVDLKKRGASPFNILPFGINKTMGNANNRYVVKTDEGKDTEPSESSEKPKMAMRNKKTGEIRYI
jgi:hypothetical protein